MAGANHWKREIGSRRRIAHIRWKRQEIVHAVILILLMMVFYVWVGLWVARHHFD